MSEQSSAPRSTHDDQRGEASPEATSPTVDASGEQPDDEGRHVDRDVEDNADLDG